MTVGKVWAWTWRASLVFLILSVVEFASFLFGVGSLPFAGAFLPAGVAALGVALARTVWEGGREQAVAAVIAASLGALLGLSGWAMSPPGQTLLSWELRDIPVPDDARSVSEDASGNAWCFDYCPTLSHTYHVDGDPREVAARMSDDLRSAGLEIEHDDAHSISFSRGRHDTIAVTVEIVPAEEGPATEADPSSAPMSRTSLVTVTARASTRF